MKLHVKFGFDRPSGFREKMLKNNGHLHVYIPKRGADNLLGSILFQKLNINILSIWSFAANYSYEMTLSIVIPFKHIGDQFELAIK